VSQIRGAEVSDVATIAELARARRLEYAKAQPMFWNPAADAVERHQQFLAELIERADVVSLVAVDAAPELQGYLFATLVPAPPVYNPGGPTGSIDDFAVRQPDLWPTVGVELLLAAMSALRAAGTSQVVVVSGQHDEDKRAALTSAGLSVASEWWTRSLDE
jgi:hypothetical protein